MLTRTASLVLLLCAAPALAQTQAAQAPAEGKKNPDRLICEKVEQIGSRVATKRVCMTAAQWAEKRQLERENLEEHQRRGVYQTN